MTANVWVYPLHACVYVCMYINASMYICIYDCMTLYVCACVCAYATQVLGIGIECNDCPTARGDIYVEQHAVRVLVCAYVTVVDFICQWY